MRKRSKYRPKLKRLPMTGFINEFRMALHTAFVTLRRSPNAESFNQISDIMNAVARTIERDERFAAEMRMLNSGARAMNQIAAKSGDAVSCTDLELLPIMNAVDVIDKLIPRLDATQVHLANMETIAARVARANAQQ